MESAAKASVRFRDLNPDERRKHIAELITDLWPHRMSNQAARVIEDLYNEPEFPGLEADRFKSLETMQTEVFEVNTANGWFDSERTFGDDIALLHSEVSEMLEAFRQWGLDDATEHAVASTINDDEAPKKPEGVGSEAADVLIRLLDTCRRRAVDLRFEYERKITYNRTRGHRHGGKAL